LGPMAWVAVSRQPHIFVHLLIDMTSLARQRHMRAEKRELRAVMTLRHVRDQPCRRRVASIASGSQFAAMDILMAVRTLRGCTCEMKIGVALLAGDADVHPPKGKP
jgi:hypothetical protein